MSNFRGYNPRTDPARNKSALAGTPSYDSSVASYNNWLYTPMDLRPTVTPPAAPQYTPATGDFAFSSFNGQKYTPAAPAFGGAPIATGSTGPSGAPDAPDNVATGQPSIIDTAPKATFTAPPAAPQNAMQRWQGQADGIKPLSDQRRYFWATGSIDARAKQADPSQNKGAVAPVQFVNSPSNWEPY